MKTFCICGGGALGHVIAGFLSAKEKVQVNVLTNQPSLWHKEIDILTPDNNVLKGKIQKISSDPKNVVANADIVLLCLPGFLIQEELLRIKSWLKSGAFVGSVFSSTGFFFEAKKILDKDTPLWGFQRVPFIARVKEYGCSANLLGYKDSYNIAVEHTNNDLKEDFRGFIEEAFERPTNLLRNYLEASLTNSNPILHTSRLYTMFNNWQPGMLYQHNILFYEEWTNKSSELLIEMDAEFFKLLAVLPVTLGYLPTILNYYGCSDVESITHKLSSIEGFKGINSPMKEENSGWVPDFSNRYFTEDFPYGLRFIWELAHKYEISIPTIDEVYQWGMSKIDFK